MNEHLPLRDNGKAEGKRQNSKSWRWPDWRPLRWPVVAILCVLAGGVLGLYFQPPGLRAIFERTGLEPGGGTTSPIATRPAAKDRSVDVDKPQRVTARGIILPAGDVVTLDPPFGAGDARVQSLLVRENESVTKGQLIAVFDNVQSLEAARDAAATQVGVREAGLEQMRSAIQSQSGEAQAGVQRAQSGYDLARMEANRARELFDRGVVAKAFLDRQVTLEQEARQELERARSVLQRFSSDTGNPQVDIVLAEENLRASRADLARAEADLQRARLFAPASGIILDIRTHEGERPGGDGIATMADTSQMHVELEVYQTDIGQIAVGQPVRLRSPALADTLLSGTISVIGREVGRQSIVGSEPAAHTDAKVVRVRVLLDEPSRERAADLVGLEVVGEVQTGRAP